MLGQGAPQSMALGQLGSDLIDDQTACTGTWGIIQCIANCTFSKLDSDTITCQGAATTTDITLAAGMSIYGRFTAITLASGAVLAYRM